MDHNRSLSRNLGFREQTPAAGPSDRITENQTIVTKVRPRRLSKCNLKSMEIDIWPSVCPLGAPLDPMITKMVAQVPKIQPEGLQNDNLWYKKTPISVANQPAAPCIQGGRRQGRSLKIFGAPLAEGLQAVMG